MKLKVVILIGTRPEAIKMAPIVKELRNYPNDVNVKLISTGQHKEMASQVCRLFNVEPDLDLGVMTRDQSLSGLTSLLFQKIDAALAAEGDIDWVMAQGDTTSVFVSSVVSFYRRVKFAHVEAGLRTYRCASPFPEEFNRRATALVADMHFAPTSDCAETLKREFVDPSRIMVTGNSVIDALHAVVARPHRLSLTLPKNRPVVLVTAHRRENFVAMKEMFEALREIAAMFPDLYILYPVHLNPNVKAPAEAILSGVENIAMVEPLDYIDFIHAMRSAAVVLTDSGGVQEEAPSFGVPVMIMREHTERQEGVRAGVATLVGNRKETIVRHMRQAYRNGFAKHHLPNPYGDGTAAKKIARFFLEERRKMTRVLSNEEAIA